LSSGGPAERSAAAVGAAAGSRVSPRWKPPAPQPKRKPPVKRSSEGRGIA
jgi:hypothetical protein